MKTVLYSTALGCIVKDSQTGKMGLVTQEQKEILPCIFDYVHAHIGEMRVQLRYGNVLLDMCFGGEILKENLKYSNNGSCVFKYEDNRFFVLRLVNMSFPVLYPDYYDLWEGNETIVEKNPEIQQATLEKIVDILKEKYECYTK